MIVFRAEQVMMLIITAFVLATPQRGLAASPEEEPPPTRVPTLVAGKFPGWSAKPSGLDMARAAPRDAMMKGLSGTTILFCFVDPKGRLNNCEVEREEHPGNGFGAAALRVASKFRMKPTKPDGTSVSGETVKFPVRFVAPPR